MKKLGTFFFSFVPFLVGYALQYVVVIIFMIISAIFMMTIAPAITGQKYFYNDLMELWMDMDFNTLVMIVFSISCTTILGIWYYKNCGGNYHFSVKKDFHPLQLAGILVMVPGTQFATNILVTLLSTLFPKWLEEYEALMESAGMGEEISLLMMIYSVCLAPFSEELIFRGVTMRIARKAFPFWIANIIQAVLFGIFHGNMLQGCYAFALGLILGYVCERGGSIYYSIFFHFLFNLWGTTSQWMNSLDPIIIGALVLFCSGVCLPGGILIFHKGITIKEKNNQIPSELA